MRKRNIIYLVISILVIFALAQPVIPNGKVQVQAKSVDIMIALDISNSMRAQDVYPSRLKMAQHKILELLKLLPEDRVGVIAFAKASYLVSPLSFDHGAVRFLVKGLEPENITEQGTDFGQLLYSTNRSILNKKERCLVIFTDGGDQKSFQDEVDYAKAHNIKVFVIALGTQKGAPIKTKTGFLTYKGKIVITKLNSNIATLATQTGGVYIKGVLSDADVKKMVEEIRLKTEQKVLKSHTVRHDISLFYYPLALALLLLVVAMSSFGSLRRHAGMFIVLLLFSYQVPSHAGILDFKTLDDANSAYKNHDYAKSSRLFAEYQRHKNSTDVRYDRANALYKDKKYKQAAKIYQKLHFQDRIKQANALYNLGNSYAKQGTQKGLEKAVKTYKKSLSLHEDSQARFNLKVVKEMLKHKKQKKEQQKNKQNQKKQNQKEQQKSQNSQQSQKNKTTSQNKKNQEGQGGQKNNSKQDNKNKKGQATNSTQSVKQPPKKRQEKQSSQEKQASQEKKNIQSGQKNSKQPSSTHSNSAEKKERMQNNPQASAYSLNNDKENSQAKKNGMSKKDVKQWLKEVEYNAPTHMYKMQQMKTKMKDDNEKPW